MQNTFSYMYLDKKIFEMREKKNRSSGGLQKNIWKIISDRLDYLSKNFVLVLTFCLFKILNLPRGPNS